MDLFIIWFALSLLAGHIGGKKGHSGIAFFILSMIFSPLIGLLWAILTSDINEKNALEDGKLKKCLYCAELVKKEATKCKHCGAELFNHA